jgi:hypothetical protein
MSDELPASDSPPAAFCSESVATIDTWKRPYCPINPCAFPPALQAKRCAMVNHAGAGGNGLPPKLRAVHARSLLMPSAKLLADSTRSGLTAILLVSSLAASAQNASGGDGTSPQNRGSTGWTGAHPETGGATLDQKPKGGPGATTGQSTTVHDESEAKDQPALNWGGSQRSAASVSA